MNLLIRPQTIPEPTEAQLSLLHSVIRRPLIRIDFFAREEIKRELNQALHNPTYDLDKVIDISKILHSTCPRIYTDEKIQELFNNNDIFKTKTPSTTLVSPYVNKVIEGLDIATIRRILYNRDVYGLYMYLKIFNEDVLLFSVNEFINTLSIYSTGYIYDISLDATKDILSRILINRLKYTPRIYPFHYDKEKIYPYIDCCLAIQYLTHSDVRNYSLTTVLKVKFQKTPQTFDLTMNYIKGSGIPIDLENPLHLIYDNLKALKYRVIPKIARDIYNLILPNPTEDLYKLIHIQDYQAQLAKLQQDLINQTDEKIKEKIRYKIKQLTLRINVQQKFPKEIIQGPLYDMLYKKRPEISPEFIVCYIEYIISDTQFREIDFKYNRLKELINI